MATEEQEHDAEYMDEKEFQAKFLLDPDIPEEIKGQFSHLDKNLAITNLRYERNGINEPDEARVICRGIHVINNSKYYKKEVSQELEDYKEYEVRDPKTGEVSIVKLPVFKEVVKDVPIFPKTAHALKASFYAFVNTSASRQGHRIRAATTTRREKAETFENRSTVGNRWSGNKN